MMAIAKDMANEAVALVFEGEGLFGTMAGRVDDRIQPGKGYLIYPANFGKRWLGGNIEIMEIKPRNYPIPLSRIPLYTPFETFGAAKPQKLQEERSSIVATTVKARVKVVDKSATETFEGCEAPGCNGILKLDGSCPHCPGEGSRKVWMPKAVVEMEVEDDGGDFDFEFRGRQLKLFLCEAWGEPNTPEPYRWDLNAKIAQRFPPGLEMELLVWLRQTEGENSILTDPKLVHVVLWQVNGRPFGWIPEPVQKTAPLTLATMYGPNLGSYAPQAPLGAATVSGAQPPANFSDKRPIGLRNPGGALCSILCLVQLMSWNPPLAALFNDPECLKVWENIPHLVTPLHHILTAMAKKQHPQPVHLSCLLNNLRGNLAADERHDIWASAPNLWRVMSHLFLFSAGGVQVAWERMCPNCNESVAFAPDPVSHTIDVHAEYGSLQAALHAVLEPRMVQWRCDECVVEDQCEATPVFMHDGDFLVISVHQPAGEPVLGAPENRWPPRAVPFEVPNAFEFANKQWTTTGVALFTRAHWWACVRVGDSVWECNDDRVKPLGSSFPPGPEPGTYLVMAAQVFSCAEDASNEGA